MRTNVCCLPLATITRRYPPPSQHGLALPGYLHRKQRCAGEIAGLTWERVNLDRRYLTVPSGKTASAKRDVPLSTEAIRIINQLERKGDVVFNLTTQQIDVLFRKAKARALIDDLHFHDSRAEAITRLASKIDILTLARMVGHRDLRMLQIYYRESAEDIAKN